MKTKQWIQSQRRGCSYMGTFMLKFLYANINNYINKKELIRYYLEHKNVDCTMFVETKTKATTNIQYRDWRTLFKHGSILNQNTRGGALVQASNRVKIGRKNPPHFNNPWNDVLHFTVPFNNEKNHMFLVYIHHSSRLVEENLLVKASQYKYSIILGDFNVNNRKKLKLTTSSETQISSNWIHHQHS